MKRWMPALCIALVTAASLGASAWEGSAMMSAYGEFPDSGYYAACNSFPRNTAVEVVNLENGKSVTVIITKGLENPGIFLLLSPEAAKAVSMEPGMVARVRVSAPRSIVEAPSSPSGPGGDPDYNPSLLAARSGTYKAPEEPAASDEPVPAEPAAEEPVPRVAVPAEEPGPPEPTPAEGPVEGTAALVQASEVPAEEIGEPDTPDVESAVPLGAENRAIREAPVVRPEVIARSGTAPRDSQPAAASIPPPEVLARAEAPAGAAAETAVVHGLNRPSAVSSPVEAALADPALVPDELPEAAMTRKAWPEDPAPAVALADLEIRMDEAGKPEALSRDGAEAPESVPASDVNLEEPVLTAKAEPAAEPPAEPPAEPVPGPSAAEEEVPETGESEVVVTLAPAAPKPPEAPPKPASAPAASPAPAPKGSVPAPPPGSLVAGKYYIQVGAFKTSSSLDEAAARLREAFPVTVDAVPSGSGTIYRLFVGPLGRDETGVALLQVRSLGFKEAFLKN